MIRYITVNRFSELSGYSADAIRSKIRDGKWLKGHLWRHAPDGRVLIDLEGYNTWVEMGEESKQVQTPVLKSVSCTKGYGAAKEFSSSPPPLI